MKMLIHHVLWWIEWFRACFVADYVSWKKLNLESITHDALNCRNGSTKAPSSLSRRKAENRARFGLLSHLPTHGDRHTSWQLEIHQHFDRTSKQKRAPNRLQSSPSTDSSRHRRAGAECRCTRLPASGIHEHHETLPLDEEWRLRFRSDSSRTPDRKKLIRHHPREPWSGWSHRMGELHGCGESSSRVLRLADYERRTDNDEARRNASCCSEMHSPCCWKAWYENGVWRAFWNVNLFSFLKVFF